MPSFSPFPGSALMLSIPPSIPHCVPNEYPTYAQRDDPSVLRAPNKGRPFTLVFCLTGVKFL